MPARKFYTKEERERSKEESKQVKAPLGHPYAYSNGQILKSRLDMEKQIGRYMTPEECIHHRYNRDGTVTQILCRNHKHHMLIHQQERALEICGDSNKLLCSFCKQYDHPENLLNSSGSYSSSFYHKTCRTKWRHKYYEKTGK